MQILSKLIAINSRRAGLFGLVIVIFSLLLSVQLEAGGRIPFLFLPRICSSNCNDPYWSQVVLYIDFEGTPGSNTIVDRKGNAVSVIGNPVISTAQKRSGSSSLYINGSANAATDYYLVAGSTDFLMSGDFTMEGWFYPVTWTDTFVRTLCNFNGPAPSICYNSAGWDQPAANWGSEMTTGMWHHVAVSRSGSTVRFFVDGIQTGSTTESGTFDLRNLSTVYNSAGDNGDFNGYVDDLKMTRGVARYTANFTPSTAQTVCGSSEEGCAGGGTGQDLCTTSPQYLSSSGSVAVPSGCNYVSILAVGAGGGGFVGGGGGGALSKGLYSVTSGANLTATVGSAGVNNYSLSTSSTAGGATTVSGTGISMTANGGNPASCCDFLNNPGGAGGTASGGNIGNWTGGMGGTGYGNCSNAQAGQGGGAGQDGSGGTNGVNGVGCGNTPATAAASFETLYGRGGGGYGGVGQWSPGAQSGVVKLSWSRWSLETLSGTCERGSGTRNPRGANYTMAACQQIALNTGDKVANLRSSDNYCVTYSAAPANVTSWNCTDQWQAWTNTTCVSGFQIFTGGGTNQSFTVPNGCTTVRVVAVGGGGGGGGGHSGAGSAGGAGGGGRVSAGQYTVTPGSTHTVLIGQGGNGGAASVGGTSGGTSSFGTLLSSVGGGGGGGGNVNSPGHSTGGSGGGSGGGGGGNGCTNNQGGTGGAGGGSGGAGVVAGGSGVAFPNLSSIVTLVTYSNGAGGIPFGNPNDCALGYSGGGGGGGFNINNSSLGASSGDSSTAYYGGNGGPGGQGYGAGGGGGTGPSGSGGRGADGVVYVEW
jgi:hypothetical protein